MTDYEKAKREAYNLQFGGTRPRPWGFGPGFDAGIKWAVERLLAEAQTDGLDNGTADTLLEAAALLEREAKGNG